MDLPLVSVLITVFNREKYLEECIQSVLSQTYQDFELIIMDDCSTDNSYKIASSYAEKSNRIRLFRNKKNIGQFQNRNQAILEAEGKYIKFIDSDDYMKPTCLEKMVQSISKNSQIGLSVPLVTNEYDELCVLNSNSTIKDYFSGIDYLSLGPSGVIYLKDALIDVGLFDPSYGILTDTFLNLKIATYFKISFFSKNLIFWRIHNDQVNSIQRDKSNHAQMVCERYRINKKILLLNHSNLENHFVIKAEKNLLKINLIHFLKLLYSFKICSAIKLKKQTEISFKTLFQVIINNYKHFMCEI